MGVQEERLVREFCDIWAKRDIDEIVAYFHPDAVYHNMPMEPATGHDAIRSVLQTFVPMSSEIEFVMHAIASSGSTVHTERVDVFQIGPNRVELPVAGVFEIRDGKIAAWRDYFDTKPTPT